MESLSRKWCIMVSIFLALLGISIAHEDYTYFGIMGKAAEQRSRTEPFKYFHLDKVEPQLKELPSALSDIYPNLPVDASELCFNQTVHWFENLSQQWAIQMIDAAGHLPSGILEFDVNWPGDYDECLSIQSGGEGDMSFHGKYCKVSINTGIAAGGLPVPLVIGSCFPSGCNSRDVRGLIDSGPVIMAALFKINLENVTGLAVECHGPGTWDAKATVSTVILAIFAFFLAAGTLFDIARKYYSTLYVPVASSKSGILGNGYQEACESPELSKEKLNENTPLLNENIEGVVHEPAEPNLVGKLLMCFSLYTNAKKIMNTTQAKGSLTCIHGIRFFSITWVVLGHSLIFIQSYIKNVLWVAELEKRWSFGPVLNATVSVDSFFVMSGLLLTYLTLRELEKRKGKLGAKGWVMIFVHRYIRLTPVYAFLIMVWSALMSHWGDGPFWPQGGTFDANCATNWWANLLYINNVVDVKQMCFGWSWYLANDMQFFIIAIPMIYLLYRSAWLGLTVLITLTVGSLAAAMIVAGTDHFAMTMGGLNYMQDYYFAPWCRFQTYGVGMLAGYFLHTQKCTLKIHWAVNFLLWAIAATLCLLPLYGPHDMQAGVIPSTETAAIFYHGLHRTSWGAGLALIIVACVTDNGGLINDFLSWKAFVPLGRLAYCVYLTNLMCLYFYLFYARQLVIFNDLYLSVYFLGILVFNYMCGFTASVVWEAPTMALEKLLFKR